MFMVFVLCGQEHKRTPDDHQQSKPVGFHEKLLRAIRLRSFYFKTTQRDKGIAP
jgi:hypothetical protein